MRLLHKIYFAFFFTSIIFDCAAQQYNFRNYNVPDGLAHSHVSKIFQDSKGYLWFSTLGGGVSKFDGKNFILTSKHTACLAQENCGVPPQKQKVKLSSLAIADQSCCTPGGGCC